MDLDNLLYYRHLEKENIENKEQLLGVINNIDDNKARAVVVGFLCQSSNSLQYENGTWVEVDGTISNGNYHSEIPIIKVTSINEVSPPETPYVTPPNTGYLITEEI